MMSSKLIKYCRFGIAPLVSLATIRQLVFSSRQCLPRRAAVGGRTHRISAADQPMYEESVRYNQAAEEDSSPYYRKNVMHFPSASWSGGEATEIDPTTTKTVDSTAAEVSNSSTDDGVNVADISPSHRLSRDELFYRLRDNSAAANPDDILKLFGANIDSCDEFVAYECLRNIARNIRNVMYHRVQNSGNSNDWSTPNDEDHSSFASPTTTDNDHLLNISSNRQEVGAISHMKKKRLQFRFADDDLVPSLHRWEFILLIGELEKYGRLFPRSCALTILHHLTFLQVQPTSTVVGVYLGLMKAHINEFSKLELNRLCFVLRLLDSSSTSETDLTAAGSKPLSPPFPLVKALLVAIDIRKQWYSYRR